LGAYDAAVMSRHTTAKALHEVVYSLGSIQLNLLSPFDGSFLFSPPIDDD
jgi:hypothetical protein